MMVYYHKAKCHTGKKNGSLSSMPKARAYIIKIWLVLLYLTAGPFATKLGLVVKHYKPECPVEKKKGITAFKVKVIAKVQNVSECSSGW